MRATVTVVAASRDNAARCEDVLVDAPATTPVGELVADLARLTATDQALDAGKRLTLDAGARLTLDAGTRLTLDAGTRLTLTVDGRPLDPMTPIAASGLREGAVLAFAQPRSCERDENSRRPKRLIDRRGYLELRVVGGPASGGVHQLTLGTSTIGRGAGCDVRLDDPDVSRRHAQLAVTSVAVTVSDLGSTNGTTLDGTPVTTTPTVIEPGMRLRVGESTLVLAAPDEPPVALEETSDGRLSYNRPPRLDAPDPRARRLRLEFPAPPQQQAPARPPLIATIAPVVAGVVLALAMRRPEYLLFTVLSPLMMAGQWLADRMGHRRANRAQSAAHEIARSRACQELARAIEAEEAERRTRSPDPAALLKIATSPSIRLWERRRDDLDFVHLRIGCGTLPADIEILNADDEKPALHDVPVTVGLRDVGVLGIAGPPERTAALGRALVAQLVVLHSPRDLGIVLLTEPTRAPSWEWIRWLPHVRPATTAACQALVGLDRDSATARITELNALIAARRGQAAETKTHRTVVVVVDGARALRGTPGLAEVLGNGPDVDVLAIGLESDESSLPEECSAVALFSGETATRLTLKRAGTPDTADAVADGVSASWAERIARALAPLRDDTAGAGADGLPDAVRWLQLAGLDEIGSTDRLCEELLGRWQRSSGGSTTALIGAAPDAPFCVDVARDGPHALVAGTTGSGKSELLQTLVASLAVANRPDELTFVLVDYKGGAAFGSCARLPHTVGLVTDLDGSLVERALVSLSAELKRREALLAGVAVANIEAYRNAGHKLARLVIVVDEFASLAEELPDFVGGLVGIAQRGRSLGVHLVLATQRPEGVVSADIRANTNLRICLAVMRDSESRDVIDAPDAARISRTTPGRGYARTGHGELHTFQTARVGGTAQHDADRPVEMRLCPFLTLGNPEPAKPAAATGGGETDLDLIVDACRAAAIRLGAATAASPWLAPLPDVIVHETRKSAPLQAPWGLRDLPARQAQEPYVVDLETTGHLVVAGSARSGRTTGLLTLAGLLARSTPTTDLHVYAFDCGGGALNALTALPHCGAVVSAHEPDRARRLMSMLTSEVVSRQTALAKAGLGSINEQRRLDALPLPHIVVFIDGWEAFVSSFDDLDAGAIVDGVFKLLREGAAIGIHVVVTSERAGLVGRLASSVESRLVLRLADRGDFALIGLPARAVPPKLPPGRGFVADDLVETQLCLLDPDPSGQAQRAALARIAALAVERDAAVPRHCRPRRVDPLPTHIALAQIRHVAAPAQPGSARIVLGVGGDELDAIWVDLHETGPGFVIAGPARSGRSTALATIATGLRANGWHVVAITTRPSRLVQVADTALDATDLGLDARLQNLRSSGQDSRGSLAVLVDDAELVTDTPAASVLDRLMRGSRDAGHVVAIAGTTEDLSVGFRGFVVEARRSRAGVLLTPRSPLDGEVLGIRLPRDTSGRLPPGRGLLVARGETTSLQVAAPS